MDALAGLAFGIVVVNVIRSLGITRPEDIAVNTVKAGCLGCGLMGVIYLAVAVAGTQSRGIYPAASNGGEALLTIARHYFGTFGAVILAVTVTFACLKTAVGLITSCSQTFCQLFPAVLFLPRLGHRLLYLFLRRSESGSGNHHRLGFACTDVSLPAGHHADPAGPGRKMV